MRESNKVIFVLDIYIEKYANKINKKETKGSARNSKQKRSSTSGRDSRYLSRKGKDKKKINNKSFKSGKKGVRD